MSEENPTLIKDRPASSTPGKVVCVLAGVVVGGLAVAAFKSHGVETFWLPLSAKSLTHLQENLGGVVELVSSKGDTMLVTSV